jgi:hypothetical protein
MGNHNKTLEAYGILAEILNFSIGRWREDQHWNMVTAISMLKTSSTAEPSDRIGRGTEFSLED